MSDQCQQIKYFENPPTDIERTGLTITATDTVAINAGQSFVNNLRDRSILSLWNTTGSDDTATTVLTFTFDGARQVDHLCFLNVNMKAFTLESFNGVSYDLLDTQTDYDKDYYQYLYSTLVNITEVRLTITATQVPDAQKQIGRIFFARKLGQLNGWPVIDGEFDSDIVVTKTLSGKSHVISNDGGFNVGVKIKVSTDQSDNTLIEDLLFNYHNVGFFVQISGGSDDQFKIKLKGYSANYILKMKPSKNYKPKYYKGIYGSGTAFDATFTEVV